jgi:hypothetical protein
LAGLVTTLFAVPSLYSLVVRDEKLVDDDDDIMEPHAPQPKHT